MTDSANSTSSFSVEAGGSAFHSASLSPTPAARRLYDINRGHRPIARGEMPFLEPGADELLELLAAVGSSSAPTRSRPDRQLIVVVGTPVDEHLNPDTDLRADASTDRSTPAGRALLVLRSTVYPGVTGWSSVSPRAAATSTWRSAPSASPRARRSRSCTSLPQIVGGRRPRGPASGRRAVPARSPTRSSARAEEAELAKLFTNTWRYIKFAAANQLYMIANDFGRRLRASSGRIRDDYPRAPTCPGPGFAAGPCLLKDTMQLAAFNNNNFTLGHAEHDDQRGPARSTSSLALERRYATCRA